MEPRGWVCGNPPLDNACVAWYNKAGGQNESIQETE